MRALVPGLALLLAAAPAFAQSGPSQFQAPGATPAPQAVPAPAPAPAAPPAGDRAEALAAARELIEASGSQAQAEAGIHGSMAQMAQIVAQQSGQPVARVTEIFEGILLPEFRARLPELLDAMAASWASHLSAADLRELTAFYRSPLGGRLKVATQAVTQESLAFGAQWGQRIGLEALTKHREALRARGLKI
ncbi:hypothetical protein BKE38_00705 [Pseudoroseomonas deserti]|uniref:DUF2059 domain-containing protein n=1 Tax=Teichococcus deserti TaxID=1817963 RepID=A0A1V2HAA1_9PROT|nr:DUF2059 domain-containing protein [Pseudoroseomonas deserti]ONG58993.1 hypothetical protein BKE38_00705 [Pseudoroseomonas deserti]